MQQDDQAGTTRRRAIGWMTAGALGFMVRTASAHENPMPAELRQALEREELGPVVGNAKGDVTLTEFFDYNCPHCRKSVSDVHRLISEDPNLRVVFREWPVFGEGSEFSARASLASLRQGKYWQFHKGLMGIKGRADRVSALRVARQVGLDLNRLQAEMQDEETSRQIEHASILAEHMGLMGTPTFIAGHDGVFGKQSLASLRKMIAQARRDLA